MKKNVILVAVPRQPGTPTVSNVTRESISIFWDEPTHDGGSPVTGYYVEKKERNSILWQKDNQAPISKCSHMITGIFIMKQ